MRKSLAEAMPPSKTVQKSVTPDSVKALMIIEAIIIAFFSFWVANEYVYNVYFRIYVNGVFIEHFTTYTIALGLGIGLAGTAAAATLYKNLREAKVKLESVAPKIRGSVEKIMISVPGMDAKSVASSTSPVPVSQSDIGVHATTAIPVPPVAPEKQTEEK